MFKHKGIKILATESDNKPSNGGLGLGIGILGRSPGIGMGIIGRTPGTIPGGRGRGTDGTILGLIITGGAGVGVEVGPEPLPGAETVALFPSVDSESVLDPDKGVEPGGGGCEVDTGNTPGGTGPMFPCRPGGGCSGKGALSGRNGGGPGGKPSIPWIETSSTTTGSLP